jgi:phosphoglycerate dehydrogenase-like enzyme
MKTIQITNTYKGAVLDLVQCCVPEGFQIQTLSENSIEALLSCVADADYILASGRVKITKEVLDRAEKLKMVQRTGVGLDSIDLEALKQKNIPLYVNQGVNAQSVAEHTILLILACLRKLTLLNRNTKKGVWEKQAQGITTYELRGKTVGIVGMGNIGRKVAGLLNAFGVEMIYCGHRQPESVEQELNVTYQPLETVLAQADVLTMHCPLTKETSRMINRNTLQEMKDGVVIVNTARGDLIDEAALFDALQKGKVSFAGLDVHAEEPIAKGNRLIADDRVIATPHIAGVTYDSFFQMIQAAMRNIEKFDKGELAEIDQYLY